MESRCIFCSVGQSKIISSQWHRPFSIFGSIATAASFSLSVQFSPAYVAQGEQLTEDIIATLVAGSPGQVSYSISGLPPKATASFSPPSCTPTCLTLLTVNIDPSTPLGT